jgi:hypothetical protein
MGFAMTVVSVARSVNMLMGQTEPMDAIVNSGALPP